MLDGLGILLPGGTDKRPIVGDGWPDHPGLTVAQLQASGAPCVCWHVGAAPGYIAIDIDGTAPAAFCLKHGCDPFAVDTWRITRTADQKRLKLVFTVTPEQKAALVAGHKTVKFDGQELAVFSKPGHQIVVCGEHYTKESHFTENDDQYAWSGRAPAEAQPLPPEWFALLTGVFCGDRPLKPATRRTVTPSKRSSSTNGWSNSSIRQPCPVCGRNHSGACSIHNDGESVWCCHGETCSAPDCSKPGERITGRDGRDWGYVRSEEHDCFGERSLFRLHKPRPAVRAPDPEPVAAAPAAPRPAPAEGAAGATGLAWLLDRLDTGTGPAGARKTTAGDLAQSLMLVAGNRLRFNQQTLLAEIDGQPIEGTSLDTMHVALQLRGMNITAENTVAALAAAALQHPYQPVTEYLGRVAADPAIETLDLTALVGMFLRPGDPPGSLQGRMLAKTLIGAVARAYQPGCKVDTTCTLVGEQGAQKSTFWEALAGPSFYSSSSLGRLEKDALLLVHATWFLEIAELETVTGKRAAGELKNFLSTRVDCFRPPYGKTMGRHQRPSVMVGTSNRTDFLTDETGSRRFWIIPVTASEIDVAGVRAIRDRIWKSAVIAYHRGERWWLDKADEAASELENQQFSASHPWEGPVIDWLGERGSTPFTSAEALVQAGLRQRDQIQRRDEMALATVLGPMGWVQRRGRVAGERKRMWFRAEDAPVPTVPTCPNLNSNRLGRANASQGNGSGELSQPSRPKSQDLPEAVPVRGSGTQRREGTEKRSGRSGQGRETLQRNGSAVPTSKPEVGTGWDRGPEVGTEAPASVSDWCELALAELRLAPDPRQEDAAHDQQTLLDLP
ncbi:MAG: virulence-associated E family protein [Synechococcaceae cyanobacterium]|nr:virulence-associated E family protein [Synechococcaceae cyanobacterium]